MVVIMLLQPELNGGLPYNLNEILELLKTVKCLIDVGHIPYYDRYGSYFYCQLIFDNKAYYELDEDQLDELINHMATEMIKDIGSP